MFTTQKLAVDPQHSLATQRTTLPGRPCNVVKAQLPSREGVASQRTPEDSVSRRGLLAAATILSASFSATSANPAQAGAIQDALRAYQRPDISGDDAVVVLMDARGTLLELAALAKTAPDSDERFHARALLPGMAKRIRQVGTAAPAVAALAGGTDKEASLSEYYGGTGEGETPVTALYKSVGRVVTISGITIRQEAQDSPAPAEAAVAAIEQLLALLPAEAVDRAEERRSQRRAALVAKA